MHERKHLPLRRLSQHRRRRAGRSTQHDHIGADDMRDFHYQRAKSMDDATRSISGDPTAKILAGGTTLIDLMKLYVERPDFIVDINPLGKISSDLVAITPLEHGGLWIGSLVRNSDLAWNDL